MGGARVDWADALASDGTKPTVLVNDGADRTTLCGEGANGHEEWQDAYQTNGKHAKVMEVRVHMTVILRRHSGDVTVA